MFVPGGDSDCCLCVHMRMVKLLCSGGAGEPGPADCPGLPWDVTGHTTHTAASLPAQASPAAHLLLALPQPALQGNWREKRIGIIKSNYTNGGLHLPYHDAVEISTNMSPTYVKKSFANKKKFKSNFSFKMFLKFPYKNR